jgi:DNA-binding transcriptional ArsR family regulator
MENQFAKITSLIGDPVRSKIMWALMDGRAYTATELALYTDTSAQNISMHLNKLVKANLLNVESQGRHRYYNYSRAEIAYAIEALANLIPAAYQAGKVDSVDKPIRFCRTCYDHLAGKAGVMLTDGLINKKFIIKKDADFEVSPEGEVYFKALGINTGFLKQQKRVFARACLDWTERRHHLAGALGAALLEQMIAKDWVRKTQNSRAMVLTGKGRKAFFDEFRVEI